MYARVHECLCAAMGTLRDITHPIRVSTAACVDPASIRTDPGTNPGTEGWIKASNGRWVHSPTPTDPATNPGTEGWTKASNGRWVHAPTPTVMTGVSALEMHGRHLLDIKGLDNPVLATFCEQSARPGYDTQQAHEYLDSPGSLAVKVRLVAKLLKRARKPILYTGAGISTASGIRDYASVAAGKTSLVAQESNLSSPWDAAPTVAHRVMAAVHQHVMPLTWVQQNHDGLPQKAGFPQEQLNEIHGAWYDPSNPVVPMCGELRSDLFESLVELENSDSDFMLAMGTSLSGMNSDRIVSSPASRSSSHSTIIVSLQRTALDALASVRIFAKCDHFARLLAAELCIAVPPPVPPVYQMTIPVSACPEQDCAQEHEQEDNTPRRFLVPYHASTGLLLSPDHTPAFTVLNLSDGAKVQLTAGPHKGDEGEVVCIDRHGHFELRFMHRLKKRVPFMRKMGAWWVEAAVRGQVARLPLVNVVEHSQPPEQQNAARQH